LTDDVLLDTHIAIWLENGDERLRPATIEPIEDCWRNGGTILLSTVSVWEIAQLVYRRRIELVRPLEAWVERFADRPGVEVLPLSHLAASRAYRLDGLEHSDPADRLLIATAIERGCPLVTYDARIARFSETHGCGCGFRAWA
jgi:PIN domain nuclease of toxin-antitoxin system